MQHFPSSPATPATPASPPSPRSSRPLASRWRECLRAGPTLWLSRCLLTRCLLIYLACHLLCLLPHSSARHSAVSRSAGSKFDLSNLFIPRPASAHPGHAHNTHTTADHSEQPEIDEFLRAAGDRSPAARSTGWRLSRAPLLIVSLGLIAALTVVKWQLGRRRRLSSPQSELLSSPQSEPLNQPQSEPSIQRLSRPLSERWQPHLFFFLLVATVFLLHNAWRTLTVELPTEPDLRAALGAVAALGGLLIGGVTMTLLGHWRPRLLQEPLLPGQSLLTALALTASGGLIVALALSPIVANRPSLFVGIAGLALVAGSGLAGQSRISQRRLRAETGAVITGPAITGPFMAGAVTIVTLLFAGVLLADGYSLDHSSRMVWGTVIALLALLLLP